MPGHLGTDFYRMVLERARDLLTALHNEVMQQENNNVGTEYMSQGGASSVKQALESKVYNMAQAVEFSKSKEVSQVNDPEIHRKFMEDHTIKSLPKVNKDEYKQAIKSLTKAGKSLQKTHIREFLSFVRPEPIIGKLFQVIAILKGYKNPNWAK